MVSAIIVAGGRGVRMGESIPKQYLKLGERPILAHSLLTFDRCFEIDSLFLVIPGSDKYFCSTKILRPLKLDKDVRLVAGGSFRQQSVYNGLRAIEDKPDIVVIHDGVRPFIQADEIRLCIETAWKTGACTLAVPAADTLKKVNKLGQIENTIERQGVWQAQTPQAFVYDLIVRAHEKARNDEFIASDDAQLVERLGRQVAIAAGNRRNIKITTPEDLDIARAMLACKYNEKL